MRQRQLERARRSARRTGASSAETIPPRPAGLHAEIPLLALICALFLLQCTDLALFGFATPEALVEHNQQQEFTIHNLKLPVLLPRDIFNLDVHFYGIALPLLIGWRSRARSPNRRGWVFHRGIAGCFLFAEGVNALRDPFCQFLTDRIEPTLQTAACNHIEESVEMYWALAALCGPLLLLRFWRDSVRRPRRL